MYIRFADFLISHSRITWSFRRLPSAQLMNIRHLEYTDFFFCPKIRVIQMEEPSRCREGEGAF